MDCLSLLCRFRHPWLLLRSLFDIGDCCMHDDRTNGLSIASVSFLVSGIRDCCCVLYLTSLIADWILHDALKIMNLFMSIIYSVHPFWDLYSEQQYHQIIGSYLILIVALIFGSCGTTISVPNVANPKQLLMYGNAKDQELGRYGSLH